LVPQCGGMVRRDPYRLAGAVLDSALALTRRLGSAGSRASGDSSLARGPLLPLLGSVPDVLMQIGNPLISPHFLEANNTSATPPIKNGKRTNLEKRWLNAFLKGVLRAASLKINANFLSKCHGRKPVGIYFLKAYSTRSSSSQHTLMTVHNTLSLN